MLARSAQLARARCCGSNLSLEELSASRYAGAMPKDAWFMLAAVLGV